MEEVDSWMVMGMIPIPRKCMDYDGKKVKKIHWDWPCSLTGVEITLRISGFSGILSTTFDDKRRNQNSKKLFCFNPILCCYRNVNVGMSRRFEFDLYLKSIRHVRTPL